MSNIIKMKFICGTKTGVQVRKDERVQDTRELVRTVEAQQDSAADRQDDIVIDNNVHRDDEDNAQPATSHDTSAALDQNLQKKKSTIPVMVDTAIKTLNGRNGSSFIAIKDFIISKYKVNSLKSLVTHIKKHLNDSIANGRIIRVKRSYKLSPLALKEDLRKEKEKLRARAKMAKIKVDARKTKQARQPRAARDKSRVLARAEKAKVKREIRAQNMENNNNNNNNNVLLAVKSETPGVKVTAHVVKTEVPGQVAQSPKLAVKLAKLAVTSTKPTVMQTAGQTSGTSSAVAINPTQKLKIMATTKILPVLLSNNIRKQKMKTVAKETNNEMIIKSENAMPGTTTNTNTTAQIDEKPQKKKSKKSAPSVARSLQMPSITDTADVANAPTVNSSVSVPVVPSVGVMEQDEKPSRKKPTRSQSQTTAKKRTALKSTAGSKTSLPASAGNSRPAKRPRKK